MSVSRKVWLILGGLVATLLLLIAAAGVLLHSGPGKRFVLTQVTNLLGPQGIRLSASSIDYNLAELRVTLNDVTVASAAAPKLPPVLEARRLAANLSLRKLIDGIYLVESASIREPNLRVVIDETGRNNIPQLPERQPKQNGIKFLIDWLEITGASFRFEDRRQRIALALPAWEATVDGDAASSEHRVKMVLNQPGRLAFEARELPIRSLSAELLAGEDSIHITDLRLGLRDSVITASATLRDFDSPDLDAQLSGALRLDSLADLAGIGPRQFEGEVQVNVAARGSLRHLRVETTVSGDDLRIRQFRNVDIAAMASYAADSRRVRIEAFDVTSPAATASATGSIALTAAAGQSTFRINAGRVDLNRLTRLLDLPIGIASRATGSVNGKFPGLEFRKATAAARIRLVPTQEVVAENVIPAAGSLDATAAADKVNVRIESLRAAGVDAQGLVALTGKTLSGQVRAKLALEDALPAVARFQGESPAASSTASGRVDVVADLGGTMDRPQVNASVRGPSIRLGTLEGASVLADAAYDPDRVVIERAEVSWRKQAIRANGMVGLKGQQAIALNARADNISLPAILTGLGRQDVPASGVFSLNAQVGGTLKQPQGNAILTGTGLSAYSQPLGELEANASIAGGMVRLDQLRLAKTEDQVLAATGTYNIENQTFDIHAKATNFELRQLVLPGGSPIMADLSLTADIAGTPQDPRGDARLRVTNLQYQREQFGTVAADLKLANQQAAFQVQIPKYNLSTEGTVGVNAPYPAKLQLAVSGMDLGSLPLKLEQALKGTVTAKVEAEGTIQNPQEGRALARIEQLNLNWQDQAIRSSGPLVARYSDGVVTIDEATLTASNSTLSFAGSVPLEATAPPGTLRIDGTFDLSSLAKLIPGGRVEAKGKAELNALLRGSLKRIDPELTLVVENAGVNTPNLDPVTNLNLKLRVEKGVATEALSANWASANIQSSGTIPFGLLPQNLPVELPRTGGPAQLTVDVNGLELASIQGVPKAVSGTVSARLEAKAPKASLEAVEGTLSFGQLNLMLGKIALNQSGTSAISVRNQTASIERFELTGPETRIQLSGTAGLAEPRRLDLKASGNFDAALISAFADDLRAQGPVQLSFALTGTAKDPLASGFVEVSDAAIALDDPMIALEDLNARLNLKGNQLAIERLDGLLNGGKLAGSGSLAYANGQLQNPNIAITADGVYLELPDGFNTVSNSKITFRSVADRYVLGGQVTVVEGTYTEPLTLERGLLQYIESGQDEVEITKEPNPVLARTRYDIGIESVNPLVIDNNLAQLGIDMDLRLIGDFYKPGLSGRVTIEEGGELYLNERRYFVERGVITFVSERKIEPQLDILARTEVSDFDIELLVQGGGGEKIETTFTSNPPLPEPDIIALLLTGRTLEDIRGSEIDVAKEQALSYLAGSLGGTVSSQLQRATGLSQVRVEPNLIAGEEDPTARLTVGQDITNDLKMVYSMDLTNSSDQIYIAEYDLTRRFVTRGIRQEDNSYRFEFNHNLQFGGVERERDRDERSRRTISKIEFQGEAVFPPKKLEDTFDVKAGERYDFFEIRKGLERLRKLHWKQDYMESRVRLDREDQEQQVALRVRVQSGPKVDFVFEGWSVPGSTRKSVREIWQKGVFDAQRLDESSDAIKGALVEDGYLESTIDARIAEVRPDFKRVLFDIQTGVRFTNVEFVFDGANGLPAPKLKEAIEKAKLKQEVYTDPDEVTELLTRYYREQGFLDASIEAPQYELDREARTGQVVFPISEGPQYRIGEIRLSGNKALSNEELRAAVRVRPGDILTPERRQRAIGDIAEAYNEKGYLDADADYAVAKRSDAGLADLTLRIEENRQSIVSDIRVAGTDATSENLVRSQLALKPGEPVGLSKLSESRRNLYRTGAFELIDLAREPLNPDATNEPKHIQLNANVREVRPWELRYGAYFDTERGPGGVLDVANRNSLGAARVLGFRGRYDSDLHDARIYFSQPLLKRFPLKTTGTGFYRREIFETFITDRTGISAQQETRFRTNWVFNYGYRLERAHTFDRDLNAVFPLDVTTRVAPLTTSLARETRDEILDATRGSFTSHALEFAPEALGSQIRFVRYFGQYFKYIPLSEPSEIPLSTGLFKSRLVYAGAVRVGLARGLGDQVVIRSERFFSGGGTSVRGFEQNKLGPLDALGDPLGGNALFVVNNELRFPLWSIFDGVGFVDVGNVYPTVSDFSLTDIRKSGGFGLRARTPWFLLRLDYGVKFDRKPGETRGRLFFSIGQAF